MSRYSKWGKRVDSNHGAIRDSFRAADGWEWEDTHRLGGGFPDGVVQSPAGTVYLIEVKKLVGKKAPKASTSAKDYTKKNQKAFAERFHVHTLCSVEEAQAFRELRS